jgi:hypothetical protein
MEFSLVSALTGHLQVQYTLVILRNNFCYNGSVVRSKCRWIAIYSLEYPG